MKKYNVLVIILSILIMTAIANLIGFIIGLIVGKEGLYVLWMILATFCAWSFYPMYIDVINITKDVEGVEVINMTKHHQYYLF